VKCGKTTSKIPTLSSQVFSLQWCPHQQLQRLPNSKKLKRFNLPIRRDPPIPTPSPKNYPTKAFFITNQLMKNQSYAQITFSGQNYTQLSSSIETLLTSFIPEFSNIIKPLISLLTSLLNKSQL